MLLLPNLLVIRRVVVAVVLSVFVGVAAIAPTTPAWADGTSWCAVAASEANNWYSVAYGDGVWVAVASGGTNRVMRSTDDGVTWTAVAVTETANDWLSVAYGDGVWVAVSYDGINQVMRSTDDGVTWTAVAASEANQWYSVAYGNGVWVAVASGGTNRVMRSTNDGVTWTAVAATEANEWDSVAYGNGVWVAVATSGTNRVMRSTDDGENWTAHAAAEDNQWVSVAYANGVWVAVSQTGTNRVMRSTDGGENWTAVAATADNNWVSVAHGNGVWVAVATSGTNRVMRSGDAVACSSSSSSADAGVPGIFLTVAGPVGRSASEAPVYYGADRVAVTSTYLLTVTRVSNVTPTITTLAEGTIDADGSFTSMTRLPALAPGTYNVQMVGTHVNGSTLQLTSQVTIGGVGQFTSIGANIPIIK